MNFLYHNVPDPMIGSRLIPLNKMPENMADIKNKNLEKYKDRKEILNRKIPLLNCLWNDVSQFVPINPQKIFQLQKELGLIKNIPKYRFYKIPLDSFDPTKSVAFFKAGPREENASVKWLKDVDFESLQKIPKPTIKYYESLVGSGELPFNYQFIPHILYMDSLDISKTEIILLQ